MRVVEIRWVSLDYKIMGNNDSLFKLLGFRIECYVVKVFKFVLKFFRN